MNNAPHTTHYREELKAALERKKRGNPHYSLRAFARDLGISPSLLQEVMAGKHGLSVPKAREIARRLGYAPPAIERFCDQVAAEHARSPKAQQAAQVRLSNRRGPTLDLDQFEIVASWSHYAILELTFLADFQPTPEWISSKLGINSSEASNCIDRLLRVGLLQKTAKGFAAAHDFTWGPDETPSAALREMHAQLLEKAKNAIETQSLEDRDFQAAILAIPRSALPLAKQKLRRFLQEFLEEVGPPPEPTETPDAVCALGLQFFELTAPPSPTKGSPHV